MTEVLLAPAARLDLFEIWTYHASEIGDIELADRIREEIFDAFSLIAATPGIGHWRRDLSREPLRFWPIRKYLIIYREKDTHIEVARVLHGARDVKSILDTEG